MTTGVYLFGFATAALLLSTLSTLGKPYFAVLLFLAAARMLLTGLYEVGAAGSTLNEIAGGFALALTVLALYGDVALGLEDAHQREVLPLFRRGGAADSFAGFEAQLERLKAQSPACGSSSEDAPRPRAGGGAASRPRSPEAPPRRAGGRGRRASPRCR